MLIYWGGLSFGVGGEIIVARGKRDGISIWIFLTGHRIASILAANWLYPIMWLISCAFFDCIASTSTIDWPLVF